MYFAMGLYRGKHGEMVYNNLKIGGCISEAEARRLVMSKTGEGFVQDEKRNVVCAVSSGRIKTCEDLFR